MFSPGAQSLIEPDLQPSLSRGRPTHTRGERKQEWRHEQGREAGLKYPEGSHTSVGTVRGSSRPSCCFRGPLPTSPQHRALQNTSTVASHIAPSPFFLIPGARQVMLFKGGKGILFFTECPLRLNSSLTRSLIVQLLRRITLPLKPKHHCCAWR